MPQPPLIVSAALLFLAACGTPAASETTPGSASASGAANETSTTEATMPPTDLPAESVYTLSMNTLAGKPVDLSRYAGKVTLFVNVASRCGYTPQYKDLQALHAELGGADFAIVGIPSNDFGGQEPGSATEIQTFCQENYGVTFDMLEKVSTKAGQAEIFDRLAAMTGKRPGWNFCKYVVSKDGTTARFYESSAKPLGSELRGAIDEMRSM